MYVRNTSESSLNSKTPPCWQACGGNKDNYFIVKTLAPMQSTPAKVAVILTKNVMFRSSRSQADGFTISEMAAIFRPSLSVAHG